MLTAESSSASSPSRLNASNPSRGLEEARRGLARCYSDTGSPDSRGLGGSGGSGGLGGSGGSGGSGSSGLDSGAREMRGLYKHSVTELDTDTESNGYASISFSDSDTASETPEVSYSGATSVLSSEKLSLDNHKYLVVPRKGIGNPRDTLTASLEAQMDRRTSRALVSGPDDTYKMPKALDQPVKPRYTQPKGYVGFSSLPDQVCSCSCVSEAANSATMDLPFFVLNSFKNTSVFCEWFFSQNYTYFCQ